MDIKNLKKQAQKELNLLVKIDDLKEFEKKYLGKKGKVTELLKSLKNLPQKERRLIGKEANELRDKLMLAIKAKKEEIKRNEIEEKEKQEWIDITVPAKKIEKGHLHPLTQVAEKVEEIFMSLGFSVIEGPEIENEWYNFDALNIPKDHPARDLWDTFWIKEPSTKNQEPKLLLRTHTSPVQIHYMEKHKPPLRIISPGRIYRYEATDASHEINFYQVEGLMIDKDTSVANFYFIMEEFFKSFFGKETKIRLRPSFFPFTEPSFEIDVLCSICKGKGCSVCSQRGWIEIAGAGMVHPNVLKAVKINPKNWQGFAFGMGLDRLAMMKYKINDIRLFYSSDLRFLKQF
ncbi:phenylalanine--tRNA ligase subunit alpha [bacterium]|nr:phenylalanine--tRNA ligase subunit alpha [bacterium]